MNVCVEKSSRYHARHCFIIPLSQVEQTRLLLAVPPSLTYLPAAQDDHVEHEPWFDVDVYFPVEKKRR